ncbi:MAG: sigma factor-like helix-turn-helix DNA-binding protein [Oscillospiraceae bacterium]|nr:sigma factor-like helix-turn-helix DNA-binding protein [Oscillospiraceae bacterium]
MEKNMELSLLLDFYGELLSEKVRRASELYYNDDLSLSEVAEDMGITRQGVRDLIKRAEGNLYGYEQKLGLYKRFLEMQKGLGALKDSLVKTKSLLDCDTDRSEIDKEISGMIELVDKLIEGNTE